MVSDGNKELITKIKTEIKGAYKEIEKENDVKNSFVDRYLKERVAVILDVKSLPYENRIFLRLYYGSYWEGLTSTFSAAVEVRRIYDLNKKYTDEEGWEATTLLKNESFKDGLFYLGSSEYVTITNLLQAGIYEARIIDHSYDSDEPPSLPYRFKVDESK